MMLDSIYNGPLVYPTVEENGQTRLKKYSELTEEQRLQDDCDVQATNIILHCLPPDVLYNLFDKFAFVQGETLYENYWRFSQLINDMHIIGMTMQQVQVNTKFLNALPPEWSKFVTNVKLAKLTQQPQAKFPQLDSGLAIPTFQQGEDLIVCINKAMAFLSAVASRGIATTSRGNYTASQPRVVKCYNCQREGHMARQYTQPKRPRNATWFKEKLILAEAQKDVH
ncbi:retrovirus-related pol polyprotein from transposon TNT 1-94, partial [Tanacetum coccineum]